jgi:ABC-type transport system substrate-binding protein
MKRVGIAVVVAALIAAACSSVAEPEIEGTSTTSSAPPASVTTAAPPTSQPAADAEERPYGGTAVMAPRGRIFAPPWGSATLWQTNHFAAAMVSQLIEPYVFSVDDQLVAQPEIVEEIPTLENGGVVADGDRLTVTYTIREEAVWADGEPISGDDFRVTYETSILPDNDLEATGFDRIIPESIVVGPKSFSFALDAALVDPGLLFSAIAPAHQVDPATFVEDWSDRHWVAGGPFQYDASAPPEVNRFVRNESYWGRDPATGQQLPYLDAFELRYWDDWEDAAAAEAAHEVNYHTLTGAVDEATLHYESNGFRVHIGPSGSWEHLTYQFGPGRFEANPDSLLEHRDFREAIAYGIDRDTIASAHQGATAYSPLTFASPSLSSAPFAKYTYDPEKAAALLDSLCERLGRDCAANPPRLVVSYAGPDPRRELTTQLVTEQLADVGIVVDVVAEEGFEYLFAGNHEAANFAWGFGSGLGAAVATLNVWAPDSDLNVGSWGVDEPNAKTERYAELADGVLATADPRELTPMILEAEQILADELPVLPLYEQPVSTFWLEDQLAGIRPHPIQQLAFWNVEEWYRPEP